MPKTKVKVTYQYPATVDLSTITTNCRNGVGVSGENTGDLFCITMAGGNIFNSTNSAAVCGAYGYPSANGYGRLYAMQGPLKACPPGGVVPVASGATYFTRFFTIDYLPAAVNFAYTIDIGKFNSNPGEVDSIFASLSGVFYNGGAYSIRGGTWLQSLSSVSLASPDGNRVCQFGPFFGAADGCGFTVKIAQNLTWSGNSVFAIGCPRAFSNLGAVVLVPWTPNFCAGGSVSSAQFDGIKATYYKGNVTGGQFGSSLEVFNSKNGPILAMGSGGAAGPVYFKVGGPSIMAVPPILATTAEKRVTASNGNGLRVGNVGDIFEQGFEIASISDNTDSTFATNGGRSDFLNISSIGTNLSVPSGITPSMGTSVFDTVSGEAFGYNARTLGDCFGSNATDYYFTVSGKSVTPYGTRTNAGGVAVCYGGAAARAALQNGNTTTLYSDLVDGTICTEYEGAVAGDLTSVLSNVKSIGTWDGNNTVPDWGVGAYARSSNTGFAYFIWGHKPPQWLPNSNSITVPDCGRVVVGPNNFQFTNPSNDNVTTYIYNVNASSGYFALGSSTTPLPTSNSFTFPQLASGQIQAASDCSHTPFSHTAGITVPGFPGSLPPQAGTDLFVRTVVPTVGSNQLRIGWCQTVLATPQNFGASSVYSPLLQDPSNIWLNYTGSHLSLKNGRLNNQTVSGYQIKDLTSSQIFVADDCSPYDSAQPATTRTLFAKATDDAGLSSAANPTSVTFIPPTTLTNQSLPLLSQGGSVQLGTDNIGAIPGDSNVSPGLIQYAVSAQHVNWADPNPQTPVTLFPQQDLIPRSVYLVSDGTDNQPFVNITLIDPVNRIAYGPTTLMVPFASTPGLQQTVPIFSLRDRTTTVTSAQILGTQKYNVTDRANLQLNVSCDHAWFPTSQPNLFKNSDLATGVPFTTDDSGIKPNCAAIISDGVRTSLPIQMNMDGYRLAPSWGPIQFGVGQGAINRPVPRNAFSLNNLLDDPATYTIDLSTTSACQHISFSVFGNPTATNFSLEDVDQGRLLYTSDGSTSQPSCPPFKITDRYGLFNDTGSAQFSLIFAPVGKNKTITYYQGDAFPLTTDMLDFTCEAPCTTNASALLYSLNPQNISLTHTDLTTAFHSFSRQNQVDKDVYVVSDPSLDMPVTITGTVTDLANDLVSPVSVTSNYFSMPSFYQTNPVLSVQGRATSVSIDQVMGVQKYNSTDLNNLFLNMICQHGQFSSISQPTQINVVKNSKTVSNDILFVTDNSGVAATCTSTASDGKRTGASKSVLFDYHFSPIWGSIQFNAVQGKQNQAVTVDNLPLQNLRGDTTYTVQLPNCQHLSWSLFGIQNPATCNYSDVQQGTLLYSIDNSGIVPTCDPFTIIDNFGNYGLNATTMANPFTLARKPQLVANTLLPLYQTGPGSSFALTTSMLDWSCDMPCTGNASALQYSVDVRFAKLTLPDSITPAQSNGPHTVFTKQDQLNHQIWWTSMGTNTQPTFDYNVTDLANGVTASGSATVPYRDIPIFPQPPSATMNQASCIPITWANVFAQDNTSPANSLGLTFPFANHGTLRSNATGTLTTLTLPFATSQGLLNQYPRQLFFCDDNSADEQNTNFGVFATNAWFNSSVATVPVSLTVFNPACLVQNAVLAVSQDSVSPIPITAGSISFAPSPLDTKTTFGQITVKINYPGTPTGGFAPGVYPVGGYFQDARNPGVIIYDYLESSYTPTSQYPLGTIQYIPDGNAPNFQVSGFTPAGVINAGGPLTISLASGRLQFTPSTAAPTVNLCRFVLPEGTPLPVTEATTAASNAPQAVIKMSSKFGDQNAIQALITNNPRVTFFNNATGVLVPLSTPVSFTKGDYAQLSNIWVQSDNAYLSDTDVNFYIAANNGNQGNAQPCSTKSLHTPTPGIISKPGTNILVTSGASKFISDADLQATHRDPAMVSQLLWNVTGGGACKYQYDFAQGVALSSFPNSAIGVNGIPAHLQVAHDGSVDDNGLPLPCSFNYTLTAPYSSGDKLTGPITSALGVIPSLANVSGGGGGFNFAVFGGSASTPVIIVGVSLIVGGFVVKYVIPKCLDTCVFEREIHNPLELAILLNMNKRLTLATNWCGWLSADKRDKFGEAVQAVIAHMGKLGITVETNVKHEAGCSCSTCCSCLNRDKKPAAEKNRADASIELQSAAANAGADRKDAAAERSPSLSENRADASIGSQSASANVDTDGKDAAANMGPAKKSVVEKESPKYLDALDIVSLAKTVVTQIKAVCIPKRKCCTKCFDRCCCCKRDVEDGVILENAERIAQRVKEALEKRSSHLVKGKNEVTTADMPQLSAMQRTLDEQALLLKNQSEAIDILSAIARRAVAVVHYSDGVTRVNFGLNEFGAKKFSADLAVIGYTPNLNLIDFALQAFKDHVVDIPALDPEQPSVKSKTRKSKKGWIAELPSEGYAAKGKEYLQTRAFEITEERTETTPAPKLIIESALGDGSAGAARVVDLSVDNKSADGVVVAARAPAPIPFPAPTPVTHQDRESPVMAPGRMVVGVGLPDLHLDIAPPASLASPTSTSTQPLLIGPRSAESPSLPLPAARVVPPPVLAFSSAATLVSNASVVGAADFPPPPPPPSVPEAAQSSTQPPVLSFSSAATAAALATTVSSTSADGSPAREPDRRYAND
jgi:hypothetical protein